MTSSGGRRSDSTKRHWTDVLLLPKPNKRTMVAGCGTYTRTTPDIGPGEAADIGASRRSDHAIGPIRHVPLPVRLGQTWIGNRPPRAGGFRLSQVGASRVGDARICEHVDEGRAAGGEGALER